MSVDINKIKVGDVLISRCNFQGVKHGDKVVVTGINKGGEEYYYRGRTHISGEAIYVQKLGAEKYCGVADLNELSLDYGWTENKEPLCKKCKKGNCLMSPQWICKEMEETKQ